MFAAVPTWCLLVLAGVAIVARRWSCLSQVLGRRRFRVDVVGEPLDVAPRDVDSRYADYHRQLTDLGFEPLGVVQESVPGHSGDREYVLVHPVRQCRAIIYSLGDGPTWVVLKSDTSDGRLVATFNYGSEDLELETDDYIDWRHPTHHMEELLDEHETARHSWVSEGATLIAPRTIEEAAESATRDFFNSSVHRRYLADLNGYMFWGLAFVLALATVAAPTFPGSFPRVFSLCVIASTAAGYVLEKWCEPGTLQKLSAGQDAVEAPIDEAVVA